MKEGEQVGREEQEEEKLQWWDEREDGGNEVASYRYACLPLNQEEIQCFSLVYYMFLVPFVL